MVPTRGGLLERKSTVCRLNGGLPRLVPRGAPFQACFRGAQLALRFRKNCGSSQSLASVLRLTELTGVTPPFVKNCTLSRKPEAM